MSLRKQTGTAHGGVIATIEPWSLAADLELRPGDELLAVNGHPVEDVIDVQFYAAAEEVELLIRRDGVEHTKQASRDYGQELGIEFVHPTFDIDIRRCDNLCPFCFVLQMPNRMRRTLYIKDDDYRYSFLFGHFVTLTNLSPHDWDRIAEQHLSPLYVSVHATDLELRRRLLRNPNAPDILQQLAWLRDHDIQVHTQLVICPGFNDGGNMDRSIADLASFWPTVQSVSVVPVGITRHHRYQIRPHTNAEAEAILQQVEHWQRRFLEELGARFVYPSDEFFLVTGKTVPPKTYYDELALQENGLGMVRDFLNEWKRAKREIGQMSAAHDSPLASRSATLATGALFGWTLAETAAEFERLSGAHLHVVAVVNKHLGESITVAGLLMGSDVVAQLKEAALGEMVILPRLMFDHPQGIALDDVSPADIARALGRRVVLADSMGDVLDAFTGQARLVFDPDARTIPWMEVSQPGGWAVEKYL